RTHFCGNPHDEWTFSGCHSWSIRCTFWCRCPGMGRGLDRFTYRSVHVRCAHDQAGRAVTDQSSAESSESQTGPRPHSMDGDCLRLRNGFPRWVSILGDGCLSHACRECMAHHSQTPEDVSTLGPEPQPEVLL